MKMEKKKKKDVFNLIAPAYGLFYKYQKRIYKAAIEELKDVLDLTAYDTLVDVGCGTGAFCSVANQKGLSVTGVDPAQRMLSIGAQKQENKGVKFVRASALGRLPFEDKSFDVSIASYVAHGLKAPERKTLYEEMSRISKHVVIIYDYNENRSRLTDLAELLEGGDYFNFIKTSRAELKEYFRTVRAVDVGVRGAWYICEPYDVKI